MHNGFVFLISNDFEFKAYVSSLDDNFSSEKLKSDLYSISDRSRNNDIFLNLGYFFKAICAKYEPDTIDEAFEDLKLDVAHVFFDELRHIIASRNMHIDSAKNEIEHIIDCSKMSNQFKKYFFEVFSCFDSESYHNSTADRLYFLFILKNICGHYQHSRINELIDEFVFRHHTYFSPYTFSSVKEISFFSKELYDSFFK